jgi:toxin-antitoxin system PIN domain toxin
MILVDANLLIYAYNPHAGQHAAARRWLETVVAGPAPVRLAWVTVLAFVRIMTSPQVFRRPLTPSEAVAVVDEWLSAPAVAVLGPEERHWEVMRQMLVEGQAIGPLVTDAHLAALAVEHGATLATTDKDFARFPGLKTINPLDAARRT